MDMYMDQGEPSEKCGELNFGLEYDFATQTLKLKIIQVKLFLTFIQWLPFENRQCPVYVVNKHFSREPDR